MKRLVIAPHDPAEFLGGTERVVQAMVRARIRRGEEIAIFAGSERFAPEGATESRGEPGMAVHRILRLPHETGDIFLRDRVRSELERFMDAMQPEIVEWHHGATLSFDLVRTAVNKGAKVIMFLHDLWVSCPRFFRIPPAGIQCPIGTDRSSCTPCAQRDLPWPAPDVTNWISRYEDAARAELCAADIRIAPSHSHADTLQHYFSDIDLNLKVVPHGLLEYDLPAPPRRESAQIPGILRIAHFGNLVAEKGLEDLADALGMLRHPDRVTLELHGEELNAGIIDKMRARAGSVVINYHGSYGSFRNIYDSVVNCDLAVFPSRAPESYGLVVDEALAAGLPVFVSNRGALRERVGAAGEVLPACDPAALSRAIERAALDESFLRGMRAAVPVRRRTIDDAVADVDEIVNKY